MNNFFKSTFLDLSRHNWVFNLHALEILAGSKLSLRLRLHAAVHLCESGPLNEYRFVFTAICYIHNSPCITQSGFEYRKNKEATIKAPTVRCTFMFLLRLHFIIVIIDIITLPNSGSS